MSAGKKRITDDTTDNYSVADFELWVSKKVSYIDSEFSFLR